MTDARQRTAYGSILRVDDGTYWYTCGSWRLSDAPSGIPSILAYAPAGDLFPLHENQKTLHVHGTTLVKVSNQPLDIYETVYLPAVADMIYDRRFGRLVFLQESRVVEVRSPRRQAVPFVSTLVPEGALVGELCHRLGLTVADIGIWGSTLMFDEPVRRHEVDVVIYGREQSYRAYERMTGGGVDPAHLVVDAQLGLCTVFRYKGVPVDLFFDPGDEEEHALHGASIRVVGKVSNQTMTIHDTTEALFYPPMYVTSHDKRLLSFRPAHSRRFFKQGCQIRFASISVVEIDWPCGSTESAYAVLTYERGEFVQ